MNVRSIFLASILIAGCGGDVEYGASSSQTEEGLSGCHGKASSSVPSDDRYYLTSFGGGSDTQTMSCGGLADGTWYYAASKQRFGCGARIQIEANGNCVVAATDDYGPDVCVEAAAGRPIIDASPLVAKHLFGVSSAGWSDRLAITATLVDPSTPLGPCTSSPAPSPSPSPSPNPNPSPSPGAATCSSATLDRDVDSGTCVQAASDGNWYTCSDGAWIAGAANCSTSYAWCHSSTLGRDVPPRTCVQSAHDSIWYQCDASGWNTPVENGAGPAGTCSAEYALN